MGHPSRRRASSVRPRQNACTGRDALDSDIETVPSNRQDRPHALPSAGLLGSIFGKEKVERLLTAVRFSCGDAAFHRPAGKHSQMRRFGLLVILLFLQSLFIAIDYLPITLEILGHHQACNYQPSPQDKLIEQSSKGS